MKHINLALIGLLLGSSLAFAGVDKETTSTQKADTAKFIGYSAFALINGALSLVRFNEFWDEISSGSLFESYLPLSAAVLAKNDAKTALNYYQKAFPVKDKSEQFSSLTSEKAKDSSTKNIHTAKLIRDSGFVTINSVMVLLAGISFAIAIIDNDFSESLKLLVTILAHYRLAAQNFYSIQEHYRKTFPSNDIKETSHETV